MLGGRCSLNTIKSTLNMSKLGGGMILKLINLMMQTLKLWDEATLVLIHVILHGIKAVITYHYKLLHTSAHRTYLSRQVHPWDMLWSKRRLRLGYLYISKINVRWLRVRRLRVWWLSRRSINMHRLLHHRLLEGGLKWDTLRQCKNLGWSQGMSSLGSSLKPPKSPFRPPSL